MNIFKNAIFCGALSFLLLIIFLLDVEIKNHSSNKLDFNITNLKLKINSANARCRLCFDGGLDCCDVGECCKDEYADGPCENESDNPNTSVGCYSGCSIWDPEDDTKLILDEKCYCENCLYGNWPDGVIGCLKRWVLDGKAPADGEPDNRECLCV